MFLKILRYIYLHIDESISFLMIHCTQLYANVNSSYDLFSFKGPSIYRRYLDNIFGHLWYVGEWCIFFKISKKIVTYFHRPYLENIKTWMYKFLNTSVLYICPLCSNYSTNNIMYHPCIYRMIFWQKMRLFIISLLKQNLE